MALPLAGETFGVQFLPDERKHKKDKIYNLFTLKT